MCPGAPLRFGSQLLLVLVGALLLAYAAVLPLWWQAAGALHPVAREQGLARLAAAYRLATTARPERIGLLLDAKSAAEARFQVQAEPALVDAAMTTDEHRLATQLRESLALDAAAVRVHLGPLDRLDEAGHSLWPAWWPGQAPPGLRVALALPDGRWLNARLAPLAPPGERALSAVLLAASALLIVGAGALALRRMLRPLRSLVEAMQAFGRGDRPPPLPLRGPRELRELTAGFNELQDRLGRYVDERTRLLASISHDLRTPLTALRLRVALVDEAPLKAAMLRSLDELQALVDETLRFSRDESRDEAPVELDLHALCADLVDARRLGGRRLQLSAAPGPLRWRGRPLALRRAIGNLLDNALQHGDEVLLRLHDRGVAGLSLEVEDDGPGIPEAALAQVMEPFVRGDGQRHGGVGLGLAIARSCVQLHGGTLLLENRSSGGLRARILLPR